MGSEASASEALATNSEAGECTENSVNDVLTVTEESIRKAESILSSLLRERRGNSQRDLLIQNSVPGIESSIRELEQTRDHIGRVVFILRTKLEKQRKDQGQGARSRTKDISAKCSDVRHKKTGNHMQKVRELNSSTYPKVNDQQVGIGKTRGNQQEHRQTQSAGEEANKGTSGPTKQHRLAQAYQRHLGRQSSESSVSPQRGKTKSSTWYDGDADTSDNSGDSKYTGSRGDDGWSSTREKLRHIKKSFGSKKKQRKVQPTSAKTVFDVVSEVHSKPKITSHNYKTMGNTVSSAEEAFVDEVQPKQGVFLTTAENAGPSSQGAHSSPTYHTAESSSNSVETPKKKVHLLIESFEERMEVDDPDSGAQSHTHLSPSFSNKSNRTSIISSQSGSSESFEFDQTDTKSSTSVSQQDDITPEQRQDKKVYYVAREIMTSEKVFVDVLHLLNIEFREYIERKMQESRFEILPEEDFARMFSNLPELFIFNEDMLKDFEDRIENWDTLKKIADVIVRKGPFLKLFTIYIRDFAFMCSHFDECVLKYPNFKKIVEDFESLPRCQNLKLKHYMLKPVQRLPQYRLLLEDYLKHLGTESIDFDDTTKALRIVNEVADNANSTVKKGDNFQRLLHLQSRLGDFELIKPGRELVKEGELQKISRKEVVPRYFILLSDCLLYTTYHGTWVDGSTSLKVSYVIMLNQLRISVPQSEAFQTEFSITSNVRSVTVRASDVTERNEWLEAINSAIEENQSKKASFLTVDQLNPLTRMEGELGDSAPVWIPDQRVTMCQLCSEEFTLVTRRHHCRACGKVVCSSCSSNKAPVKYRQFEAVRVCGRCFDALRIRYRSDPTLLTRFKKRDTSRAVGKYIPQRLKLSANAEESQMSGYLKLKKGSRWKTNWFVLKDRVLYTYKASEDNVAVETLPVLGWRLETLADKNFELYEGVSAGLVFQLSHPGGGCLVFCAENDNFAEKWMTALRESVTLEESIA